MTGVTSPPAEASPRGKARLAGVAYVLTIVLGGVGESISGRVVVPGEATVTATNALAHAALLLIRVNAQGAGMAMVFFGCYALLKGYPSSGRPSSLAFWACSACWEARAGSRSSRPRLSPAPIPTSSPSASSGRRR